MPDEVLYKRPVCRKDAEVWFRDAATHDQVNWNGVPPLERERARKQLDLSIAELAQVLEWFGKGDVSVDDVSRWESEVLPSDSTTPQATFYNRLVMAATARHDAARAAQRLVPSEVLFKAQGGEESGVKAPKSRARRPKVSEPANYSEAIAAAEESK